MAILEVKNLQKKFGDLTVLKGVDFSLEKGQTMAVIGASGGGKTTLLRCLNFLEIPTKGQILVNGNIIFDADDERTLSEKEIRQNRLNFGLVFQNFNLFPQYTAFQNIALAPKLLAKERPDFAGNKKAIFDEIDEKSLEILSRVGLSDKKDFYPHQLSGGQQQRVAIARALAFRPAIILADEPTGNLDSKTGQDVLSLLKISAEKYGQTIVMITHNDEIAQTADRIIRIEDGRIVAEREGR